jgi:phospholipase C
MSKKIIAIIVGVFTFVSNTIIAKQLQDEPSLMQKHIKHVVILMLENRSFDNVLAWLYSEKDLPSNFIPADTDPLFLGLSESILDQYTNVLKNSSGQVVFSCAPIKGIPSMSVTKFLNSPRFDPNETFPNVTIQIFGNEGGSEPTMSGFLQNYASLWNEDDWMNQKQDICAIMETYTNKELPFVYGLARHYAVSDRWFSPVPTQTNPNRAFSICGTSEGEIINGFLGKNLFQSNTIWNCLAEESPKTTWSIFWQTDMLPVLFPGPYNGLNTFARLNQIPNLQDHFQVIDAFHELARKGQLPDISLLEPQWTISLNLSPKEKEVLKFIMYSQEFIVGLQGNDFHPPGDIRTGENFLANIYTSLSSNKEAWNETLLIVTFDEHGGLFDHVPPPAAIAPDNQFQNGFKFDRYGVRVPTIFISPLINQGTIIRSSDPEIPFDHTSIIATILKWKNIDKSKWNLGFRVDRSPTFENVITLSKPREDYIIGNNFITSANNDAVYMGEPFCLRNKDGNYLCSSVPECLHIATVGPDEDKICLEFVSGSGKITHGSFCTIKSPNSSISDSNLLDTQMHFDCIFSTNKHVPSQWWTIKSLEHPFLGADICFGDRIYIENHIYLDTFQLVPGRLSDIEGFFGRYLNMKPITCDDNESHYWVIERSYNK